MREGLCHVVVRAGVQALHLVPLTVLGREHEDWRPGALRAQDAADPVAVDARQHEVEHDRVEGLFAGEPQPVRTGERDVHGEAIGHEAHP
jgi:hypothetical protein